MSRRCCAGRGRLLQTITAEQWDVLAEKYETLPASSKAMIHIATIDNLAKRITDETAPTWRGTY